MKQRLQQNAPALYASQRVGRWTIAVVASRTCCKWFAVPPYQPAPPRLTHGGGL